MIIFTSILNVRYLVFIYNYYVNVFESIYMHSANTFQNLLLLIVYIKN